jgi:hypothetical protein
MNIWQKYIISKLSSRTITQFGCIRTLQENLYLNLQNVNLSIQEVKSKKRLVTEHSWEAASCAATHECNVVWKSKVH